MTYLITPLIKSRDLLHNRPISLRGTPRMTQLKIIFRNPNNGNTPRTSTTSKPSSSPSKSATTPHTSTAYPELSEDFLNELRQLSVRKPVVLRSIRIFAQQALKRSGGTSEASATQNAGDEKKPAWGWRGHSTR